MITNLLSRSFKIHQFILVSLMLIAMGTITYFWKLGFLDGSRSTDLHQADYIISQISEEKWIAQVENLTLDENTKMAMAFLNRLEKRLDKIDNLISHENYSEVKKKSGQVKTAMVNLISFPKMEKVMSVFTDKLEKFNTFVLDNKWKTLTRMSERLLAATKGPVHSDKLKDTIKTIEREFDSLEKITENSVLSRSDKSEVISRLSHMRIEVNMLKKYDDERIFFMSIIKDFQTEVETWINQISPELSLQKLQLTNIGRYYMTGMLLMMAIVGISFFAGIILNRLEVKRASTSVEKFVKNYITENIMQGREVDSEGFSEEFLTFTNQTSAYVDKRMSYGAIFQEANPFASVLLDQNLKVIWSNKSFNEQWDIVEDDIKKQYLSWDYLQKFTNIGENDPILDALQNGIAGIYQIQVKPGEDKGTIPYEMYVSPVLYNRKTRVMLFFYPLSSLQETINDQARSIVGPINKSLDAFLAGAFENDANGGQLVREFEIAGILPIYDKFTTLFKKHQSTLTKEKQLVTRLSAEIEMLAALVENADKLNIESINSNREQIKSLKDLKSSVVELAQLSNRYESLGESSLGLFGSTLSVLEKSINNEKSLKMILEDLSEAFPRLDVIKESLKQNKADVAEAKTRLSHGLAQFIHLKKKINDPILLDRFSKTFERVSDEFSHLDLSSKELEKKMTTFDVMMSKVQMIVVGLEQKLASISPKGQIDFYQSTNQQYKIYLAELDKLNDGQHLGENEVVAQLQHIYKGTKANWEFVNSLNLILKNSKTDGAMSNRV